MPGGAPATNQLVYHQASADDPLKRDWATVAEADRGEPLPGFARWAPAERIDCPPEVRARFGSHRKYTNRLARRASSNRGSTSNSAARPGTCWRTGCPNSPERCPSW